MTSAAVVARIETALAASSDQPLTLRSLSLNLYGADNGAEAVLTIDRRTRSLLFATARIEGVAQAQLVAVIEGR